MNSDPTRPYHYLAGPMTNLPQFNFPRFLEVAAKLRAADYNIINPAELDDRETFKWALPHDNGNHAAENPDGNPYGDDYLKFLRRDVNIVTHPNCVGVICLENWEDSRGARIETFIATEFELETLLYFDRGDSFDLVPFNRQEALLARYDELEALQDVRRSIMQHLDPPRQAV